ncbi:hypothetical protein JCM19241_5288 [Vibrio ishigakensis]|uniref:Uncharacterized protein n=1 Tax=Vibrio ishigakensis TaxID=1481914 RepID=A0A0B8QAW2_9VIBR|nr:hypothetical protein JCM19241_5288 [Vibrio ishigakensis]
MKLNLGKESGLESPSSVSAIATRQLASLTASVTLSVQ